jgi:hypothetical protein
MSRNAYDRKHLIVALQLGRLVERTPAKRNLQRAALARGLAMIGGKGRRLLAPGEPSTTSSSRRRSRAVRRLVGSVAAHPCARWPSQPGERVRFVSQLSSHNSRIFINVPVMVDCGDRLLQKYGWPHNSAMRMQMVAEASSVHTVLHQSRCETSACPWDRQVRGGPGEPSRRPLCRAPVAVRVRLDLDETPELTSLP